MENFIRAMPKVELNLRLEGTFRKETLLTIAEQNEIPATVKRFNEWVELLENPDYKQLDEITRMIVGWLQQPEDLTRVVYDAGVTLSRQNIKYVEVCVNPALFMLPGMTFESFLDALNDGRDRVQRGWGIQMAWILVVPRDEPRRADDISRWATSASGKRSGVVGFGLVGREDAQPVGQFERAFHLAEKKDVPRVVQAGHVQGVEGILEAFEHLHPSRVIDGWGAADAPDVLKLFSESETPLVVSMAHALVMEWVDSYASYPLRRLYDEDIKLVLSSDMPSFYNSTLTDEYLAAVEHVGLSAEELEEIALNAVRYSFLPEEEKSAMLAEFQEEYQRLRDEQTASQAG